jgi:superfamily I DNA/RNA helicase
MANALIAHNADRIAGRTMQERAANGPGEVVIRQYRNAEGEADAVVAKIEALIGDGVQPSEIIVLAQRAAFAAPIFERLKGHNIPTKSYYAEAELDTIEAQERFAVFKLLLNNEDRVALRWLLGRGHSSWRATQYARLMQHVRTGGASPWVTLERLAAGQLAIPRIGALLERFNELRTELTVSLTTRMYTSLSNNGYAKSAEELLAEAVARCRRKATTIQGLYDALYVATTEPEVPLEVTEVRLMSLHKVKA